MCGKESPEHLIDPTEVDTEGGTWKWEFHNIRNGVVDIIFNDTLEPPEDTSP